MTVAATNKIQELNLELIRASGFNGFHGAAVADALEGNRGLWTAAVLDRVGSLIKLRDLATGHWNVDTLFILPEPGQEDAIYELALTWDADEVEWIGCDEACDLLGQWSPERRGNYKSILRVWWD